MNNKNQENIVNKVNDWKNQRIMQNPWKDGGVDGYITKGRKIGIDLMKKESYEVAITKFSNELISEYTKIRNITKRHEMIEKKKLENLSKEEEEKDNKNKFNYQMEMTFLYFNRGLCQFKSNELLFAYNDFWVSLERIRGMDKFTGKYGFDISKFTSILYLMIGETTFFLKWYDISYTHFDFFLSHHFNPMENNDLFSLVDQKARYCNDSRQRLLKEFDEEYERKSLINNLISKSGIPPSETEINIYMNKKKERIMYPNFEKRIKNKKTGTEKIENLKFDYSSSNISVKGNKKYFRSINTELSTHGIEINDVKTFHINRDLSVNRGIYATKIFKKGEIIYEENLEFLESHYTLKNFSCSFCLTPRNFNDLKQCSLCKEKYCSMECYRKAHKLYHKELCNLEKNSFSDLRILLEKKYQYLIESDKNMILIHKLFGLILSQKQLPTIDSIFDESGEFGRLSGFPFYERGIIKTSVVPQFRLIKEATKFFRTTKICETPYADFRLYFTFYDIIRINNMEFGKGTVQGRRNIGIVLPKITHFLNHSCSENCQVESYPIKHPHKLFIVAKRDIEKGEQLTRSYITVTNDDARLRSKDELFHFFLFRCTCPYCLIVDKVLQRFPDTKLRINSTGSITIVHSPSVNVQAIRLFLIEESLKDPELSIIPIEV